MPKADTAKLLIAVNPATLRFFQSALAGYELVECHNIDEVKSVLNESLIDLCVVSIHFDDSRAMEIIQVVRLDDKNASAPIVVTRALPSTNEEMLRQTLATLVALGTVSDYLELEHDPLPEETIRGSVIKHLRSVRGRK